MVPSAFGILAIMVVGREVRHFLGKKMDVRAGMRVHLSVCIHIIHCMVDMMKEKFVMSLILHCQVQISVQST